MWSIGKGQKSAQKSLESRPIPICLSTWKHIM